MSKRAMVTRTDGSHLWVGFLGEEVPCALHGWRKTEGKSVKGGIIAGDEVEIERLPDDTYVIKGARSRRSQLAWPQGAGSVRAANVDQLVIVEATREPDFSRPAVERLLAAARSAPAEALVVVNKCDLESEDLVREWIAPLVEDGVEVLLASAASGRGLEGLRVRLAGRTSAIAGRPGVGKSRLVRAMYPGYDLPETRTAGRRSVTPVSGRFHPLPGGGYLAL